MYDHKKTTPGNATTDVTRGREAHTLSCISILLPSMSSEDTKLPSLTLMKKKSWATFERVFKKKDDHHHRHSTVPRRSKMSGSGESGKSVKSRGTRHSVAVSHSTIDSGAAEEDPGDQVLQYERIMAQKVCSFSGLVSFTIIYLWKRSKTLLIFKTGRACSS